jgi:hypothetical protein
MTYDTVQQSVLLIGKSQLGLAVPGGSQVP